MNNFTSDEIYQSEKSSNLPILVAEDIIKIYRTGKIETQALRGVSFTIYEREKLFLIGPSGSGKTTLVNIVAGNVKPTSGKVFWKDLLKDITRSSFEEIIKARRSFAGLISQDTRLVSHLTVKENVELVGYYANLPSSVIKQRSEFLLNHLDLLKTVFTKISRYLGEKKQKGGYVIRGREEKSRYCSNSCDESESNYCRRTHRRLRYNNSKQYISPIR